MANQQLLKVGIVRGSVKSTIWRDLIEQAAQLTKWSADEQVYAYEESVSDCTLRRMGLGSVTPRVDALEGRIFTQDAELKWMVEDDGYRGWIVREVAVGTEGTETVLRPAAGRTYFLLGIAMNQGGPFEEGRYPNKIFEYPINVVPNEDDRAFIEVIEYERPSPHWPVDASIDTIETLLTEPMLVAHRFMRVGVGRTDGRRS